MDSLEIGQYLIATAWADGELDGREQDKLRRLLVQFDISNDEVKSLMDQWSQTPPPTPSLELDDRDEALALLSALLVISYSDGEFSSTELPFLAPLVDKFQVTGDELQQMKLQALYYLRLEPESLTLPHGLIKEGNWPAVEETLQATYQQAFDAHVDKTRAEIDFAEADTLYLAINVGFPSFDTSDSRARFKENQEELSRLHNTTDELTLLKAEAEKHLVERWQSFYLSRCRSCKLEAPGKRRDPCPRCGEEYGATPSW